MRVRSWLTASVSVVVIGCGGGTPDTDGGLDASGHDAGATDAPLSDLPSPDAGCTTDADGDGHRSIACGGDDCNDLDASAYPGNPEVCDARGHDEDCDPSTLGPDGDGDTFPSTACCNTQPGGMLLCGTDCDDTRATVNPSAVEACNGVDDNCNGMIDDGAGLFPDCDSDGYGDPHGTRSSTCTPSGAPACTSGGGMWNMVAGDCNDTNAMVHPGVTEICDGIDNDCMDGVDGAAADTWCGTQIAIVGPHVTTAACLSSGMCGVGTCTPPFLDCESTSGSGCETDPASAAAHCGSCAHSCLAAGTCVSSACDEVVEISMLRSNYSCARHASGSVACWGYNGNATLGDGTRTERDTPVAAGSVVGAAEISAGRTHACARRTTGALRCWGDNTYGALGNGTFSGGTPPAPVAVSTITNAIDVSAGDDHSCAILMGGAAMCWGKNDFGQLGVGSSGPSHNTPVAVTGLTDALAISAGAVHTCALRPAGAVVCWGDNTYGQLGDGSGVEQDTFAAVTGITTAVEVSAGFDHTCALLTGGTVKCWGDNTYGQLGDGTMTAAPTPVTVSGIADAVEVSAGGIHACARRGSGAVVCWGYNAYGQLGDGTTTDSATPVAVSGLTDAVEISVGDLHTCARSTSQGVVCWGRNDHGQIGDGTNTNYAVPTAVAPGP